MIPAVATSSTSENNEGSLLMEYEISQINNGVQISGNNYRHGARRRGGTTRNLRRKERPAQDSEIIEEEQLLDKKDRKKERRKRRKCSIDSDFRTGDGLFIAAAGCPGQCMEEGAGGNLRMDLCKSGDGAQQFSITAASANIYGDAGIGFNIVGRGGSCIQPETCRLPEDAGGNPLPVDLVLGNCLQPHARWVDRGGILVNYGCLLGGNSIHGHKSTVTALSAFQCIPMATPFATVLEDSLFFLDECAVQDVNGFDVP